MKLASAGFSVFDRELLERQLKIVGGHTATDWIYVGESHHEADVIILRLDEAGENHGLLDHLLTEFRGVIAIAGNAATYVSGVMQIEWPLRVFSLLGVLDGAEKQLDKCRQARPLVEQLASLQQDGWIMLGTQPVKLSASMGVVQGTAGSFAEVLDLLANSGLDLAAELQGTAFPPLPLLWTVSVDRLVWSLALRQGADLRAGWMRGQQRFHLKAYPHFEEWEVNSQLLRLAALFTRNTETLSAAVLKTGASTERVCAFLYACEQCHLLEVADAQVAVVEKPPAAEPEVTATSRLKGLLGSLRSRLGL